MRTQEEKMIKAIRNRKNWDGPNTSVRIAHVAAGEEITVCLFGNLIATIRPSDKKMIVTDAGWTTATTKSRINTLLNEFTPLGGIFQKQKKWYFWYRSSDKIVPWKGQKTVRTRTI